MSLVRVEMPLSGIVEAIASGLVDGEAYSIYTASAGAPASTAPTCVLDDPVQIDEQGDSPVEVLPPFAAERGLEWYCFGWNVVDTIDNTAEQRPDGDTALILANLEYYLKHDTWLDL